MPDSSSQSDIDTTFTAPSAEQWREAALAGLSPGSTLQDLQHHTLDGLDIQVLYHESRAAAIAPTHPCLTDVNDNFLWDNRLCLSDTRDIPTARQRLQEGLAGGNSSVELYVNADTDLNALLQDVLLDIAPVSLRAGPDHEQAAANLLAVAEQQPAALESLHCSFNADPLADLLRGRQGAPLHESLEAMAAFAQANRSRLPNADTVLVDCTIHHNAGASAAQELQAGIATAALYLSHLLDAGMSLEEASQAMVLQVACDADLLMGVVKLRSLKQLWQNLLLQLGGEAHAAQPGLKLVAETSRRYLSRLDPWNNHLRNITACSAAAMGGAASIIVHPHDRIGNWRSTDDPAISARMARNLPIILERESGLTGISDPLAGSHAVETLTHELTDIVAQSLQDMGDTQAWIDSLNSGSWQAELAATQQRRVAQMQADTRIAVGVNRYQASDKAAPEELPKSDADTTGMETSENASVTQLPLVRDAEAFERPSSSAEGDAS